MKIFLNYVFEKNKTQTFYKQMDTESLKMNLNEKFIFMLTIQNFKTVSEK